MQTALVERYIPDNYRSRVYIRLTESGREYINGFLAQVGKSLNSQISKRLTEDEKDELKRSIQISTDLLYKTL